MAWTIESALDEDLVHVVSRDDNALRYIVRVGTLRTNIEINLRRAKSPYVEFQRSHNIQTPLQAGPYVGSLHIADSVGAALRSAISGITMYYQSAIDEGELPNESWLVSS